MDIKITPKNTDQHCHEIRYFFLPFHLENRLQRAENGFSGPIRLSVCKSCYSGVLTSYQQHWDLQGACQKCKVSSLPPNLWIKMCILTRSLDNLQAQKDLRNTALEHESQSNTKQALNKERKENLDHAYVVIENVCNHIKAFITMVLLKLMGFVFFQSSFRCVHRPPPSLDVREVSPTGNILSQRGTRVTMNESILIHYY